MKIAVCETNMISAQKIADAIREFHAEDMIRCFTNIFSLVTYVYEEKRGDVDLVILPIDIGEDDGVEAAHSIQEFYPGIQVVFLSDLTLRIQEIFSTKMLYLLLRPISNHHLRSALQRAHEQYEKDLQSTIALKFKGNLFRINVFSIHYVESSGRRLYIYTSENKWEMNMNMEDIRRLLPENFVLCHRSYLVNTDSIMRMNNHDIELFNHMRIPVARNRAAEIMQLLADR